mmetsp:Transcript_90005/g.178929  ORF Transcript_90005/g.178929 Transcript_90005/m.178929 type:complete len:787 (+) Transcript_90005:50-2410(+)
MMSMGVPAFLVSHGSFNPVHRHHLEMMEAARQQLEDAGFHVVRGVLGITPASRLKEKGADAVADRHRLAALQLGCDFSSGPRGWLVPEARGVKCKSGRQLVRLLSPELLAEVPGATIFKVVGADTAVRHPSEMSGHVIVISRKGSTEELEQAIRGSSQAQRTNLFVVDELSGGECSSTKVREALKASDFVALRDMCPEAVTAYLIDHQEHLYVKDSGAAEIELVGCQANKNSRYAEQHHRRNGGKRGLKASGSHCAGIVVDDIGAAEARGKHSAQQQDDVNVRWGSVEEIADSNERDCSHSQAGQLPNNLIIEVNDCKKANGIYVPRCELYGDKQVWKRRSGGGPCYIFFNPKKEAWFINDTLCNEGGFASIGSTADEPPFGLWDRSGSAFLVAQEPAVKSNWDTTTDALPNLDVPGDAIEVRECKKGNGIYELQIDTHNGKGVWKTANCSSYIFFSAAKQSWYISSKLADQGYASIMSTADRPPSGRWDRGGTAVLVEKQQKKPSLAGAKTEVIVILDSPGTASRQFRDGLRLLSQQFDMASNANLEEDLVSVVKDFVGSGFTQCGLPDLGGEMTELEFPVHVQILANPGKKPAKATDILPIFVPAGPGRLAARGAPSARVLEQWVYEAGATRVVTLLRNDEPGFDKVRRRALELIDQGSLQGWLHVPLSGGSCVNDAINDGPGTGHLSKRGREQTSQDEVSLARIDEIAGHLRAGESVVVHCAAGMHRTGIVCYMLLRLIGQSPDEACDSIKQSRKVTYVEVTKTTKKHAPLCELAEKRLHLKH